MLDMCWGVISKFIPINRTYITILWTPTKNMPAKKPTIISIHFNSFLSAKPSAYPRGPEPAKGIMFDNKTSLLIFFLSLLKMFWDKIGMKERNHSPPKPTTGNNNFSRVTEFARYWCYLWCMACRVYIQIQILHVVGGDWDTNSDYSQEIKASTLKNLGTCYNWKKRYVYIWGKNGTQTMGKFILAK
jgi:hypothetical protein